MYAVLFAYVVERADMGMVETADGSGFSFEAFPARRVVSQFFGEDFDSYGAVQPRIGGRIHLSHATRTNLIADLIRTEFCA